MATTPIKLKRSHTQAVIPDTSDLIAGEVALNTVDKKFYVRDDSNAVVTLSNHYGTDFDTNVVTFKVTVASSTSAHTYHGTGSSNKYKINGVFSPYLKLIPRITYRFDQSDSSNSGHPLLFYYDAAKSSSYSTGVTTNGTPGSAGAYTQIIIGDSTPPVLFYQCSAHGYMGWALTTSTRNFTGFDTDDLSQGSSNLYYTDAKVQTYINTNGLFSNGNIGNNQSAKGVYAGLSTAGDAQIALVGDNTDVSPQIDFSHDVSIDYDVRLILEDAGNRLSMKSHGNETMANFNGDGAVELYHDNQKKLSTNSDGVQILDNGAGSTAVLELGTGNTTEQGFIRLHGSTANKSSSIYTSNGNLHIDSASGSHGIYLNWYTSDGGSSTNGTIFGGGNSNQVGRIDGSGNLTISGTLNGHTVPSGSGTLALTSDVTSGSINIQDEGSTLSTQATTLNFVGSGVTASGTGTTKTITISGGGTAGVTVQDEGSALSTTGTTLNFVGAGVTASGTGATKTITIGGSGSSAADDITTGDAAVTIATSSGDITIDTQGNDNDIIFKGTDGGSDITALRLDMSDAGKALFNHDVFVGAGGAYRFTDTHGSDLSTGIFVDETSAQTSLIIQCADDADSGNSNEDQVRIRHRNYGNATPQDLDIAIFKRDPSDHSQGNTAFSGNVSVSGLLSATTKSFDIEHPTQDNMRLRYGVLEGPEHGVYVRGKLENNSVIELPEHWLGLVDEDTITVQLTPNSKHQKLYVKEIKDNKIKIGNSSLLSKINCFYFIQATRKDVDRLEVEYEN